MKLLLKMDIAVINIYNPVSIEKKSSAKRGRRGRAIALEGHSRASALGHHIGLSPRMFALILSFQAARLRFMRKLHLAESVVSRRIRLSTIFLSRERFCSAWSLRTVLASSFRVTSRTQCS